MEAGVGSLLDYIISAFACKEHGKQWKICRIWGSHSGGYEVFYLLEYKAVWSGESQPSYACYLFHAGLLLRLFFDPEYRSETLLRNVG
jgi:hypothetical protein